MMADDVYCLLSQLWYHAKYNFFQLDNEDFESFLRCKGCTIKCNLSVQCEGLTYVYTITPIKLVSPAKVSHALFHPFFPTTAHPHASLYFQATPYMLSITVDWFSFSGTESTLGRFQIGLAYFGLAFSIWHNYFEIDLWFCKYQKFIPFLSPNKTNNVPQYVYATTCLSIQLLMNIQIIFRFWLLKIKLL